MCREQFTNEQLFAALRSEGAEREQALKYLFRHEQYRELVEGIVEKGGGNEESQSLIYKNCIIQLDKVVRTQAHFADNLADFFESEAKIAWCSELIINDVARKYVLQFLAIDEELRGKIYAAIRNNSGSAEDAADIYQNGLILIETHIRGGKYRGGAIKGYFYTLCFNLWRNDLKKIKEEPQDENTAELSANSIDPQKILERKEYADFLANIFSQLGESCRQILRLKFFVVDRYTMDEIAKKMGFKNAQIASNTLSKCRKQLWILLNNNER